MRKRLIIVGVRKNTELIIINHIDKLLDLEDYKKKQHLQISWYNFEKK